MFTLPYLTCVPQCTALQTDRQTSRRHYDATRADHTACNT